MACTSECPELDLSTAVPGLFLEGHPVWPIDYAKLGMPRYDVYYYSPCRRMRWTWFGAKLREARYAGYIRHGADGRGLHAWLLWLPAPVLTDPPRTIWDRHYDPPTRGSEPFDDLYDRWMQARIDEQATV